MTVIFELRTFQDIYTAALEELSISASDTIILNRVKRDLNVVYQHEVAGMSNWWWARRSFDVVHKKFINAGTISVTNGSRAITFSSAPTLSQERSKILISNENTIYEVQIHSAGGTSATLQSEFTGTTSTTAGYKLFKIGIALPSDCRETFEVRNDFFSATLANVGLQKIRSISSPQPFREGRPAIYTTSDFVDPTPYSSITSLPTPATRLSSGLVRTIVFNATLRTDSNDATTRVLEIGNRIRVRSSADDDYNIDSIVSDISTTSVTDDTITYTSTVGKKETSTADTATVVTLLNRAGQAERYRELIVFPYLNTEDTTLHIDYIRNIPPLVNDSDEPVIPIEDRIILLYGVLARAWVKVRNQELAVNNFSLFQAKIARMMGKTGDSSDHTVLGIDKGYIEAKRDSLGLSRSFKRNFENF